MRYASVCSGAGTCALAWHGLGWDTAWFSENAPFPSAVLRHRFPTIPNHGDMLAVLERLEGLQGRAWGSLSDEERSLCDLDLLASATPCQAFSNAGGRRSLEDVRGNLMLAFCRMVELVDRLRPGGLTFTVSEQVPGVLNVKDNAWGCFLGALCGEDHALLPPDGAHQRRWRTDRKTGARYFSWPDAGLVVGPVRAIAWRVVDSKFFGVPQRRRRVIALSCASPCWQRAAEVLSDPEGVRWDPATRGAQAADAAAGPQAGPGGRGGEGDAFCLTAHHGRNSGEDTFSDERVPYQCHGNNIGPMGTIRSGNGAVTGGVPFVEDRVPYQIQGGRNVGPMGTLVGGNGSMSSGVPFVTDEPLPFDTTHLTGKCNRANQKHGDPCHTLSAGQHPPAVAYRTFADGGAYEEGDCVGAVTAAGERDQGQRPIIQPGYAVRRLTPVECERLQAWPDGHSLVPYGPRGKPAADGPRYRLVGNGWTRTVFEYIGRRIDAVVAAPVGGSV